MDKKIVQACLDSPCFGDETFYAEQGGHYKVIPKVRLYKELEDDQIRVVFPTEITPLEEGTVVAITCLYDRKEGRNIYAHTICAGSGVNILLRAIHAPLGGAHPQPGLDGEKAILKFVEWKRVSWGKFLNDDLELGIQEASAIWVRNFWKALDRMFGGSALHNCPKDYHWKGE